MHISCIIPCHKPLHGCPSAIENTLSCKHGTSLLWSGSPPTCLSSLLPGVLWLHTLFTCLGIPKNIYLLAFSTGVYTGMPLSAVFQPRMFFPISFASVATPGSSPWRALLRCPRTGSMLSSGLVKLSGSPPGLGIQGWVRAQMTWIQIPVDLEKIT